VDRVENHVEQSRDFTENAKKELYQASVYASKARKVRKHKKHIYSVCLSLFPTPSNVIDKPFEIINFNPCAHVEIHPLWVEISCGTSLRKKK
jgi:SNARE domain